jgi:hypothetical protein
MTIGSRRFRSRVSRLRRGLSLIEVMFAIGVVMIGLLGIAVLIPIAGKAARDGVSMDRASRAGMNAVREFHVREMSNPRTWRYPDHQTVVPTNALNPNPFNNTIAYCLDPRFVALNNNNSLPANAASRFFPYTSTLASLPAAPRMKRISMRAWYASSNAFGVMGQAAADEIFVALDDLEINAPIDPQLPAEQVFYNLDPVNPDKRQSRGEFSWMATIAPRNDGTSGTGSDQSNYILSIVVFQGRDAGMPMDDVSERWAIIPFTMSGAAITANGFYSGGIAGGDVMLVDKALAFQLAGVAGPAPSPADLAVKRGQWIMLARNSAVGPMYRWYKVTEVDPDEAGITTSAELLGTAPPSGFAGRHVTLSGQDWTFDPLNQTLAYIVPGVVAVYEKSIRLETSSLWTQ